MMKSPLKPVKSQKGFTIVELMIATAVLSTLLVLVAVVMIGIGRLYYKGINQSRIQNNTRTVVANISRQLQLITSDGTTNSLPFLSTDTANPRRDKQILDGSKVFTISAYCIGDTRYTYILNRQIGTDTHQIPHVLWRDKTPGGGCGPANLTNANLSPGVELIGPNSSLTAFSITNPSGPESYVITVAEAYGEIFGPTSLFTGSGINTTCLGNTGDEFCATASLTTTIARRLVVE